MFHKNIILNSNKQRGLIEDIIFANFNKWTNIKKTDKGHISIQPRLDGMRIYYIDIICELTDIDSGNTQVKLILSLNPSILRFMLFFSVIVSSVVLAILRYFAISIFMYEGHNLDFLFVVFSVITLLKYKGVFEIHCNDYKNRILKKII